MSNKNRAFIILTINIIDISTICIPTSFLQLSPETGRYFPTKIASEGNTTGLNRLPGLLHSLRKYAASVREWLQRLSCTGSFLLRKILTSQFNLKHRDITKETSQNFFWVGLLFTHNCPFGISATPVPNESVWRR